MNRLVEPPGKSGKREPDKEPMETTWKTGTGRAYNGKTGGKATLERLV